MKKLYRQRVVGKLLIRKLAGKGAILIEGAKWCGKTTTAEQIAKSVLYMSDLAHAEFVNKLEYVAGKYGVTVHKIDRFFPSSKTCTCGYVNKELTLRDRHWTCPECGTRHHRDELAACNILRQGIAELESGRKTTCRPKTA